MRPSLAAMFIVGMGACGGDGGPDGEVQLLGIGDSYQDFWDGADIVDVVGERLGRSVDNRSVAGEVMLDDGNTAIPNQYADGAFTWVVATGGGNDLGDCGCGNTCGPTVDALISESGTGAIPELANQIIADGAQVAWVGYVHPLPDAEEFTTCDAEWDAMAARLQTYAAQTPGFVFINGIAIGDGTDPSLYAEDGYHTSEAGSAALAAAVVEAIQLAEQ